MPRPVLERYGGSRQVRLATFAELRSAVELPETWWAILSCPLAGLRGDTAYLQGLDGDGDARIHVDDLRRAVRWTAQMLDDCERCIQPAASLPVSAFSEAAAGLKAAAHFVLNDRDAEDRTTISLEQVRAAEAGLLRSHANGDGIVPPSGIADSRLAEAVRDILTVVPGASDRSGTPGVDVPTIDRFATERDAAIAWLQTGAESGYAAHRTTAEQIEELSDAVWAWFALVRLQSIATPAVQQITSIAADDLNGRDRAGLEALLARLPLAPPASDGRLRWEALHPTSEAERLRALRQPLEQVVGEDLADGIDQTHWQRAEEQAQAISDWSRAGAHLPGLRVAPERLHELDDDLLDEVRACARADADWRNEVAALGDLTRLLGHHRHLMRLARNMLALPDLYAADRDALFEQGVLYMAGRAFTFAMLVRDRASHAPIAQRSGIHVLYAALDGPGLPEGGREIAVPVAAGKADDLWIGRRGIFRDTEGRLHEARLVQVIDNPVSLSEAMMRPFARIGRYLSSRLERWQNESERSFDTQATTAGTATPSSPLIPTAPAPTAATGLGATAPLVGGSLALAALGSSFAFVTAQLAGITAPRILFALFVLCLLIMIPVTLLAAIRLFRRNVAGLLEAAEWAVNDRMRLTLRQCRLFTRTRTLLPVSGGSQDCVAGSLEAADPGAGRNLATAVVVAILSGLGLAAACAAVLLAGTAPNAALAAIRGGGASLLLAMLIALPIRRRHPAALGWSLALLGIGLCLAAWTLWTLVLM
ncbi:MAG: hypothetical protein ACOCXJ_03235 [Planctomycetota bacterium]